MQVADDTAAGIVRRWDDRNRRPADVDAEIAAARENVRKVLGEKRRRLVRDVEIDAVESPFLHLEVDRPCHNVARCQFAAGVVPRHEAAAVGQQQPAALAADRLRYQEGLGLRVVEAGRMELDELHVRNPAAGAPRHRNAVTGRGVGVGRVEVDLARSAGSEQRAAGAEGQDLAVAAVQHVSTMAALIVAAELGTGDQIDRDVILENADVGLLANLARQCSLHREASRVGDMDDPASAVAAFARQMVTILVAGEGNALVDQPVHRAPPVLDHEACRAEVIQAGAGGDRVANVRLDRIAVVQDRGDSALCPARGAVLEGALADQRHAPCCRQPQRRSLAGQSTADYENIKAQHQKGSSPAKRAATIARDRTAPVVPVAASAPPRPIYPASVWASFCRSFSQAENSRPSSGCVSPRTTLACIRPSLLPQS
ncbi:MAG: hypothetical protein AW07_04232 [Candidatus Accumulibacter sp. SK-11]|nr:MAG: hypothetical protein AW07_04232 [Candidatus Accumulibacter sp. SK-11]